MAFMLNLSSLLFLCLFLLINYSDFHSFSHKQYVLIYTGCLSVNYLNFIVILSRSLQTLLITSGLISSHCMKGPLNQNTSLSYAGKARKWAFHQAKKQSNTLKFPRVTGWQRCSAWPWQLLETVLGEDQMLAQSFLFQPSFSFPCEFILCHKRSVQTPVRPQPSFKRKAPNVSYTSGCCLQWCLDFSICSQNRKFCYVSFTYLVASGTSLGLFWLFPTFVYKVLIPRQSYAQFCSATVNYDKGLGSYKRMRILARPK